MTVDTVVQLSILIPSHREGLLPCSRIVQACSWAGSNIEVIVRDNSGNAQKRDLLARFQADNCRIIAAEPCHALINLSEILRLARGEFIFMLADDDFCFDHAIAALPDAINRIKEDPSIVGVTGTYVAETSQGSSAINYQNTESNDVVERATAFLNYGGPNVLHYSPIRRELVLRIFALMNSLPCYCSFHDQITCFLYLLNGKFARLHRLLYLYDVGVWQNDESAQKRDVDFYKGAGLDPAINKLQWLMCGFEGAALTMHSDAIPHYPAAQRQIIADRWFSVMFARFKRSERQAFGSPFAEEAERLCAKYRQAAVQMTFEAVLADISGFMKLFSKVRAQCYFDFWSALIGRPQPVSRVAETVTP